MNPTESAAMLAALCDTLLPGEGNYPSASVAGIQAVVANRLRDRYGTEVFERLAEDLSIEGRWFPALSETERVDAVNALHADKPDFFTYLLMAAYLAYYASPQVIEAIRLDGHIYNDAPQPLGYEMTPFSFTPGLDVPFDPKGWYKPTELVERIDLSSLADLDLPTGRERA
ncbi:MAG: gluconate 2-dehydrogenase subunit 3 family protein [Thermomicrobiales bacterium]|nr:gluconate 2-dehydrogenase subunit 3 family protein [Thermomicrobiales bacterium]